MAGMVGPHTRRHVRVLVGASAGGPADFLARLFSQAIGSVLHQAFVVENRPGASGTIAARTVARAAPDGHTLLVAGPASTLLASQLLRDPGYDAARELAPVALLAGAALVLVVHPSLPVDSVQSLLQLARANPPPLSCGTAGRGSTAHLAAELFSSVTGTRLLHVPFKGDAEAVTALLSGDVQLMLMAPNVALPHVKSGRLRALAVTAAQRLASMPNVATVRESGLQDCEYSAWIMAFSPAGVPSLTLQPISEAWDSMRRHAAVRDGIETAGLQPVGSTDLLSHSQLDAFLAQQRSKLDPVLRKAGLTPQ